MLRSWGTHGTPPGATVVTSMTPTSRQGKACRQQWTGERRERRGRLPPGPHLRRPAGRARPGRARVRDLRVRRGGVRVGLAARPDRRRPGGRPGRRVRLGALAADPRLRRPPRRGGLRGPVRARRRRRVGPLGRRARRRSPRTRATSPAWSCGTTTGRRRRSRSRCWPSTATGSPTTSRPASTAPTRPADQPIGPSRRDPCNLWAPPRCGKEASPSPVYGARLLSGLRATTLSRVQISPPPPRVRLQPGWRRTRPPGSGRHPGQTARSGAVWTSSLCTFVRDSGLHQSALHEVERRSA